MLDTGLARPPSPTYTAITPATRAPERNEPSAKTDLPAEETVSPPTETENSQRAANNERDQRSLLERYTPTVERQNIIDEDSESLVYIATNTETGNVVRQIPSETLLRLRAYSKTVETQQTQDSAQAFQRVV
ncbi:flagellar protein FlaG [Roseibium sediminicola]|uniref:Flagellar protein FlaG n=1 Tax=Roseibium sediminicola TaxID=2933272 RepID=A0ABT0H0A1_9HYPH|nr:flagellar protein FlaG [Roseibium sp. CAU 1639]MCK7614880.1 flagellar protein FlaG [Roseibium sp. CAU 1639]